MSKSAKKETGNKISTIASLAMRKPEAVTKKQIKSMGASLLSQDETKGKRKK